MCCFDEKIEKAQEAVEKTKARYDAAVKELRDLLDKKDAQRKQKLLKAVENSPRTYDEIMAFLCGHQRCWIRRGRIRFLRRCERGRYRSWTVCYS